LAHDDKAFIATQAPLENTFNDFWQMIFQENVQMIVMLCKLKADNRVSLCPRNASNKFLDSML